MKLILNEINKIFYHYLIVRRHTVETACIWNEILPFTKLRVFKRLSEKLYPKHKWFYKQNEALKTEYLLKRLHDWTPKIIIIVKNYGSQSLSGIISPRSRIWEIWLTPPGTLRS